MPRTSLRSVGPQARSAADGPESAIGHQGADTKRAFSLRLARAALAPAFGAGIALAFALPWLALGRGANDRMLQATAHFGFAATLAAGAALLASALLARSTQAVRMAVAFAMLVGGTIALSAFSMTLQLVLTYHRLSEIPLKIAVLILGISGAGALYNVLSIALPLLLPLGLPLTLFFAFLIARKPR